MKVRQYKDILLECLVTLRHARTFVTSREKMHPTGVELYDNLIVEVADALSAPEPDSAQETEPARCEHGVWAADHCWQCNPVRSGPFTQFECEWCGKGFATTEVRAHHEETCEGKRATANR